MMNLFRKKRSAEESAEVRTDPTPPTEPAPTVDAAPPSPDPAPSYESWSPDAPGAPLTPMGMGQELAPQLVEPDPEAAETLPPPPGIPADHPLAGQIARALSAVYDPEIPVDIYQLGLVYNVTLNEQNDAQILMTLTTPGCPVAGSMPGMVEHAVQTMVEGIGDVEVELVWDPPWTPDMMSEAARLELGFM